MRAPTSPAKLAEAFAVARTWLRYIVFPSWNALLRAMIRTPAPYPSLIARPKRTTSALPTDHTFTPHPREPNAKMRIAAGCDQSPDAASRAATSTGFAVIGRDIVQ